MIHPWLLALAGGLLIGSAAAILWLFSGRIAGISGVVGELATAAPGDRGWRVAFLGGLALGGLLLGQLTPGAFGATGLSFGGIILSGALVGVGTTLGNGCTSGHGVCGIARLSKRSITATGVFMVTAALVVFALRHALGGGA